ncbi:hypothetical protein PVAP13_7NG108567 [Panicum virgatum]|uniref:Protein kinase domain-containing protein n=1 Tax=Panicum virgatum TaxID=38727 RepID=A0A8T0PV29_PANVG|nr:hypothetical protein PVAP13_7NG108567 [Panicum virgatum]
MPLQGQLAPSISNLSFLSVLNLTNASLAGPIPPALGHLRHLRYLVLNQNSLSGSIPGAIGNLTSLQILDLYHNKLAGWIPPELQNLRNLMYIRLDTNYLSRPIPAGMFNNTPLLISLNLGNNSLSGPIPVSVGSLSGLKILVLQDNQLSDPVPPAIFNNSVLQVMALVKNNNLTGPIPDKQSFNLPMLQHGCQRCRNLLLFLWVEIILLVIPADLGQLKQLSWLNLAANQLTGNNLGGELDFLDALSSCRALRNLDIAMNSYTGSIPNSVGNFSNNLQTFYAHDNQISGSLPAVMANLSGLIAISLYSNQLRQTIPPQIMLMANLQILNLYNNLIVGPIPIEVGMMTRRVELHLGIGNLSNLQSLTVYQNNLSSFIPNSLWHLENLIELNLSHNSLSGMLLPDIGSVQALVYMDLSTNHLSGPIPFSLGQLQADSIPDSLGKLTSIVTLDLSNNSLFGTIPNSLASLMYLTNLNLSFNNFEGQIPTGGIFSNIPPYSLVGNGPLCGLPRLGFPPCARSSHSAKLHILKYILPSIAALVIAIIILSLIFIEKFKAAKEGSIQPPGDGIIDHMFVSYHDIIRATRNFSDENLIGVGSFGKVFKAQLSDGLIVAIKVLNMESEQASKSFDIECQALRMARHRNLVRILRTCSNLDFKALVLEYMHNGSLESLLHSEGRLHLGFIKRLDIMLDVAMALEYLHYHHCDVILHCNLKPSNVLLDEEYTAPLADFGIAKQLLGDGTSVVISASMPGTIGYMAPGLHREEAYGPGIQSGELSLRQWVNHAFPSRLVDVIDPAMLQEGKEDGFGDMGTCSSAGAPNTLASFQASAVEVGLLCSDESPDRRIPMNEVVNRLKRIRKGYISQPEE